MATYPGNVPAFPVHSAKNEYPKSADRNTPNREIEAIATELGTNPKTISPVTPAISPASVAAYLDMIASAITTIVTVTNWYDGAVPIRRMVGGSGGGLTVPASSARFVAFGTLESTLSNAFIVLPYHAYAFSLNMFISGTQPGTGTMVIELNVNDLASSIKFTVPAGGGAGIYNVGGSVLVPAGEPISLTATNNATGASAIICGWSVGVRQTGL